MSSELLPASTSPVVSQVRGRYVDWRMLRDVKRRRLVKEYAPVRLRTSAVRKNTILPREIQVKSSVIKDIVSV